MSDDSLIFLFPGQGSQSIGMLANLNAPRQFSETFQEASDHLGYDVWALAQNGPEDTINKTEYTQPLLLTASVALWRWWHTGHHDSIISGLAGHSLGEYSALVCAGSLAFTDALSLVQKRGKGCDYWVG
jgi:[acyl-carrier-protein] S-malonyltransferase